MADVKRKAIKLSPGSSETGSGMLIAGCSGHIVCNANICGGCKKCEIVCSLYKEGMISPALARITVGREIFDGYICQATACRQCDGPACLLACPVPGALYVDAVTGARVIDEAKCTGCRLCLKACPTTPKGIYYDAAKKVCFKCDLCGGDPQCVKFCPTGALKFVKSKEAKRNAVIWLGRQNTQS